jgi:flagellar basal body-associated protein FliL
MNSKLRILIILLLIFIVVGSAVAYFLWNKPQRNVENEKGIEVTAAQLVKEYQANEADANKKYLDKAIQVTGTITEIKSNQEGNSTVMLASDDAFTGVLCTLKHKTTDANSGAAIVIKGICSGMLTDVRLREAVIVK